MMSRDVVPVPGCDGSRRVYLPWIVGMGIVTFGAVVPFEPLFVGSAVLMDRYLPVVRTADDVVDSTIVAMRATGVWDRTVRSSKRLLVVLMLVIGLGGWALLGDPVLAVATVVVAAGFWVFGDQMLAGSTRRRMGRGMGDQLVSVVGARQLWVTDAGLSDSGGGITTVIAWDRLTHHVQTQDRHVFCAGLAAVIEIPKRGDVAAVAAFAADADARMRAARDPQAAAEAGR